MEKERLNKMKYTKKDGIVETLTAYDIVADMVDVFIKSIL